MLEPLVVFVLAPIACLTAVIAALVWAQRSPGRHCRVSDTAAHGRRGGWYSRPGVTLPLDEGQRAWLERYAAKYPDASNPNTQISLAEAKAREARQLTVSS
jgi:hypothetical protein